MSQLIFCLQPGVKWLWFVCPLWTLLKKTKFLPIYFRWGEGSPTSVLGSQPIIWLLSLSPSDVRWPEVTKYEHLVSPAWPTFLPNGHLFDGLILSIQIREDSISLTSTSPWAITWQYWQDKSSGEIVLTWLILRWDNIDMIDPQVK